VLRQLLSTEGEEREVVLLYGSATVDDILLREELDEMVGGAGCAQLLGAPTAG
jgi:NAD(P)H-flavin reductase